MTPDAPIISKNENTAAIMRPKKFILLSEKSDLAETLNSYQDSKRKAGFKPKILNTKQIAVQVKRYYDKQSQSDKNK